MGGMGVAMGTLELEVEGTGCSEEDTEGLMAGGCMLYVGGIEYDTFMVTGI